ILGVLQIGISKASFSITGAISSVSNEDSDNGDGVMGDLTDGVAGRERCEKKLKVNMETCSSEICEGKKRMDQMEQGLGDEMQFSNRVEHRVTDLENREQETDEEIVK
nr:hypothetical protein [Tanacetum cinerariifolium]